jgi:hypothetical protein
MMEDISLEDIAMGIMPKKAKGKKLATSTTATIKSIMAIIEEIEGKSVSIYKKLETQDKKALRKAYEELSESCYMAKTLIRESATEEERMRKGRLGMSVMMSDDDEY